MRTRFFPFLTAGVIAVSAAGPVLATEAAKPRFSLDASRDGFVRLDTITGAVTHCNVVDGKWTCDEILSGGAGLTARIDALALEVARLSAATQALDGRLTRIATAGAAATPAASAAARPAHATITGTIVTRFMAMVRLLKHGRDESLPSASRS